VRLVIDASIAACWCFRDEEDPRADTAFTVLQEESDVITPFLFWFEIRNAALLGVRRKRITEGEMAAFLSRLENMIIGFAALPETAAVFALAHRHRLSFYDAAYLELAMREGCALATLDEAIAKAARAEGTPLIGA
jgi:predicted nucleic acid-binding protein